MCGMSIVSVKQSLMNGVAVVHRISCTAIEPRHGRGGTARQLASCSSIILRMFVRGWRTPTSLLSLFFTLIESQFNSRCQRAPGPFLLTVISAEKDQMQCSTSDRVQLNAACVSEWARAFSLFSTNPVREQCNRTAYQGPSL
jgi:hypothetical protein